MAVIDAGWRSDLQLLGQARARAQVEALWGVAKGRRIAGSNGTRSVLMILINIPQDLAINFVQISIEDITTKHGAHFELLNYELQRWELGRWVTVAKHGHR